ncbi:PH domain-containing protein, partial [Lysinibacillus odysseyi]|uniref:PH domain-containing protein n=1 Tax=Lysinibacillus odysseyi TaxID=202611 RepID=UPI000569147F
MTFRYPKIKLLYDVISLIQGWLFPIFFFYIVRFTSDGTFWITLKILLGIVLIVGLFNRFGETLFTHVEFLDEGAHVYTGVFSKKERFVPKEKFENIQTSASIIQKIFRAAQVTMETGDATGDIELTFVPQRFVPTLESYILTANVRPSEENEIEPETQQVDKPVRTTLFTPSTTDLLKASLTSFSFLAIFPVIASLWSDWKVGEWLPFEVSALPLALIIILIVLFVILAIAFGIFKTFNAYYRYDISMDDERIYVKKGWLSSQSFSIRKEKVQAVIYKQSLYQRLLKVTTIRLISTGEILASEEQQINEFFPYLPTAKANELIAQMLPHFTRQQPEHQASNKAKALIFFRLPIFSFVVLLGAFWKDIFFYLAAVTLLYTYIARYLQYSHLSFAMNERHLQITTGAFTIETIVTNRPKLIEMECKSSTLQRRFNVMDIHVANRAKPIHISTLQDIDEAFRTVFMQWFEARKHDIHYERPSS